MLTVTDNNTAGNKTQLPADIRYTRGMPFIHSNWFLLVYAYIRSFLRGYKLLCFISSAVINFHTSNVGWFKCNKYNALSSTLILVISVFYNYYIIVILYLFIIYTYYFKFIYNYYILQL